MRLNISEKIKHIVGDRGSEVGFNYGMQIQNLRKSYKLSQGDFGALLGMTKGQISSYEREVSQPTLETLNKIAQFFNCTLEELTEIPVREEFYLKWLLDQEEHFISFTQEIGNQVEFKGSAGLIEIQVDEYLTYGAHKGIKEGEPPIFAANFLLLEGDKSNSIINHFEKVEKELAKVERKAILLGHSINQQSAFASFPNNMGILMEGYPLLVQLYIALDKCAWLGNPVSWPTKGTNILALRLSSGKIIRLHISTMATGCYLYATYSKELEERINLWVALKKKDAMKVAIDYALEWNRLQTEAAIKAQEIAIQQSEKLPKHFDV